MVAVIVEDGDAVPLAGPGEATLDAAEFGEAFADRLRAHAELVGDGQRRRGVQRVVEAGHRQLELSDVGLAAGLAVADHHAEARAAAGEVDVDEPHVGLRGLAIGDDAAVLDAADQLLHRRMVEAHHREAV